MATIDASNLPRPVAGSADPLTPPPAPAPAATQGIAPPPLRPPAPATPSASPVGSSGGKGPAPKLVMGIVAMLGVVGALVIGGLVLAGGALGGGASDAAVVKAVEADLGTPIGNGGKCLERRLVDEGLDAESVRSSRNAAVVANAIVDCVDLGEFARVAGENAQSNGGWDAGCVEASFKDASDRTWADYLEALFVGDGNTAASIEYDVFGHC